jgi:hypothetical protein
VTETESGFKLEADFFPEGNIAPVFGERLRKLFNEYGYAVAKKAARKQGKSCYKVHDEASAKKVNKLYGLSGPDKIKPVDGKIIAIVDA